MEQNVRCARRSNPEKSPDDAGRSGGIIESSGFTKRHIGVIIFENSS
jgi:hypothetical protein